MTFEKWIRTPKGYVAFIMVAYLALASLVSLDAAGIITGITAVSAAVVTDVGLCLMEKRKRILPDGALITGLIIALVLSTVTPLLIVAMTAIIAILSKHLLVFKRKPIFNPAAFGLLVSILLFQTGQSWWGAFGDSPVWMMLFLLIGGYLIENRVNKFPQVFAFLATTFILLLIMGQLTMTVAADAFRLPFINATLFFGFFMLTDVPTSPAKTKDQVLFGIMVAIVGTIVYAVIGGLTYLFIGLLVGNFYYFLKKRATPSKAPGKMETARRRNLKMSR